jgi:hypothetical protein
MVHGLFKDTLMPEAPTVKNPLSEPGIAAMQKRLAGARTNKMMKPPKPRPRTSADFAAKGKPGMGMK